MWFAEAEEVVEVMKGHFPWTCLLLVPILIAISPVNGAHDFTAYRMQQFDLHGSQYGKLTGTCGRRGRRSLASAAPAPG